MSENKSPEIPKEWKWVRLGEVIEFQYGKGLPVNKRNEKGNIPVYGSNGIVGYHSIALVDTPCIVIGRKGAVGEIHLSKTACWPIDTTYYIIPPSGLDLVFTFYLLKAKDLSKLDKSTAIPGINRNDAYNLYIPLLPLPEQQKIVEILEEAFCKVDAGVEGLKKIKKLLFLYRQSVLKYAFEGKLTQKWRGENKDKLEPAQKLIEKIKKEREERYKQELEEWKKACEIAKKEGKKKPPKPKPPKELPPITEEELKNLPRIPQEWKWVRLEEVGIVRGGKRLPKNHKYSIEKTNHVYLRVKDFENFSVDIRDLKYISEDTFNLISKYTISKDDIYISIAGTIGLVGIIPEFLDGANLTENAAKISIDVEYFNKFLMYFLSSPYGKKQIKQFTTYTNQPKLALFRIELISIPLLTFYEQQKIVEEIEYRLSIADKLEEIVDKLLKLAEKLKQSYLKYAFEGKLTEEWRKENPHLISGENSVEKLLEKIKAEKEKIEKQKKKPKVKHKSLIELKQ